MMRYVAQRVDAVWCVIDSVDGSTVDVCGPGSAGASAASAAAERLNARVVRVAQPDTALRVWRKAHGLTQTQLATALGITWLTVQRWEAGTREPPPYLHLALERLGQRPSPPVTGQKAS